MQNKYPRLFHRIQGLVFCGTPHRGSSAAGWGILATRLLAMAGTDANSRLLRGLSPDSETLDTIQTEFMQMLDQAPMRIYSFQESKPLTGMKGLHHMVSGHRLVTSSAHSQS